MILTSEVKSVSVYTVELPLTDTSLNRYLPIAATLLMWPFDMVPIEAPLNTILKNTPKCKHYSIKWTDFCGPSSTWTVQNSLDNADGGMCLSSLEFRTKLSGTAD